jgi:dTMP kinase
MKTKNQGLVIAIDGTDGSGKETQTELLKKRLETLGYVVQTVSFPRYGEKAAEQAVSYLKGEMGADASSIDPYLVSTFFADDRKDYAPTMLDALAKGHIVISDRYVAANVGHQGSKFDNPTDRDIFLRWLFELEYEKNKIPKPDINFILHVPTEVSQQLIKNRGKATDIHEKDPNHLRKAEAAYLELPKLFSGFTLINCIKSNVLMSSKEIHEIIWSYVSPLLTEK